MELFNSAINDTWKLCTLGGFLGLFLLTLLLTNSPQTVQISNSRSTVIAFISSDQPPAIAAAAPSPSSAAATTTTTTTTTTQTSYSIILSTKASNSTAAPPSEAVAATVVDDTNSTAAPPSEAVAATVVDDTNSTAAPAAVDQHEMANESSNSTVAAALAANETSYNNSAGAGNRSGKSAATATLAEYDMAANETSFNSTEFIQAFNSSTSLEEKLFSQEAAAGDSAGPTWAADEEAGPTGEAVSSEGGIKGGGGGQKCKLYEGRWVYKPQENPRYRVQQCPFLEEKMSCAKNGRPDLEYEGWSWESDGCQIPLFDAKDMLERMRGKRMLIAGDSLNRNKWESLACLLYSSLTPKRVYVDAGGPAYKVLKALDYDFTLEFYWAPFLVHFNEQHRSGRKVVVLDELVPSSKQWVGADVMVFNSGHWWTHDRGRFKPWESFEYGGEQVEAMQTELAYERALSTWSDWLNHNVDPTKTKVYFRSISPEHKSKNWCFNVTRPIEDDSYVQLYPRSMLDVVEGKLREINGRGGVHVNYLNITKLSTYRMDAHPGIFRFKHWKIITQKYKRLLPSKSDCSHWCLPGLPDTWNRILYASLFFDNFTPGDLSIS